MKPPLKIQSGPTQFSKETMGMVGTPEMGFIKEVDRALEDKIESKRQQIEVLKRALAKAERELSEMEFLTQPF